MIDACRVAAAEGNYLTRNGAITISGVQVQNVGDGLFRRVCAIFVTLNRHQGIPSEIFHDVEPRRYREEVRPVPGEFSEETMVRDVEGLQASEKFVSADIPRGGR